MISREKKAKIVEDLARNTRSLSAIATRHGVPVMVVHDLRDEYGPEIPQLIKAAAELRRPVKLTKELVEVEPEPVTLADVGDRVGADGLTVPERAALRAWASASGRPVGLMGRIPGDLVAEWTELGKPTGSDDGVVDVAVVEDESAADVVVDGPTPLHLSELLKIVLLDVQDLIPYAVVHMPVEVRDLVHAGEQFVEAVRCDQIDRQRADQLAEVLFDMALRGDLAADRDRLADTARQILAVVDAA